MFSYHVAVTNQYACTTIMQADEAFKKSCDMCCNSPRCLYNDCDRCRLAAIHHEVVERLKGAINSTEQEV